MRERERERIPNLGSSQAMNPMLCLNLHSILQSTCSSKQSQMVHMNNYLSEKDYILFQYFPTTLHILVGTVETSCNISGFTPREREPLHGTRGPLTPLPAKPPEGWNLYRSGTLYISPRGENRVATQSLVHKQTTLKTDVHYITFQQGTYRSVHKCAMNVRATGS